MRYTHANVASFFFIFVYAPKNIKYYIIIKLFTLNYKISKFANRPIKKYIRKVYLFLVSFKFIKKNIKFIKKNIVFIKKSIVFIKEVTDNLFKELNSNSKQPSKNNLPPLETKGPKGKVEKPNKISKEFLQWFVGFSDAESAFLIYTKNNREVHFLFQITLHLDDIAVLHFIRNTLNVGTVSIKDNACSFRVNSFSMIVDTIIPIFDKYPLLTHKQLNFRDWKKAVFLKKVAINLEENKAQGKGKKNTKSISPDVFQKITDIKNGMNRSRTNYEGYTLSSSMITENWLVGFVEGDGTFHFSNSSVVFGITQKDKKILEAIADFIQTLPLTPPNKQNLVVPNKPNCIIKNNKIAWQLVVTDKDVLFQYIYPFFKNLTFYSRKKIDFAIWGLGLYIFIYGYNYLPQGKEILLKLSKNMNTKRYFNNVSDFIEIKELENLFLINPPFDIHSGKSHFILAKDYSLAKGSRKGFKVYIYKEGVEIQGSPFNSFRLGGKAIGLNSVSSIRNYLDTGKIFKGEYTFYSSPQSIKD